MIIVPQWDGHPREIAEAWRLSRGSRVAACSLWTHPKGGEARLTVDGEWHRGEAGRDGLATGAGGFSERAPGVVQPAATYADPYVPPPTPARARSRHQRAGGRLETRGCYGCNRFVATFR